MRRADRGVARVTEQIKVELYTLSTCPWSRNAKAWLDDKRIPYDYVDYDLADAGLQGTSRKTCWPGAPPRSPS